jgi:hypothetical protein
MSDFREIVDYLQSKGLTPEQDDNWINVSVTDNIEITMNGPFFWNDHDPYYGVSIIGPDIDLHYRGGWQVSIVEWLDKNLGRITP